MKRNLAIKFLSLALIVAGAAFLGYFFGFNLHQILAICTFTASILGALLFWNFRLSFAFLGCSILLLCRVITIDEFIRFSSMEVIFFLIGMMILAGFLKEVGFFNWIISRTLIIKNLNSKKFLFLLIICSALLACLIDEVSSIVFMLMIIFELCDYYEVDPKPFVISSVFATNIGSAGTVIGNPIGILIATKASLTFEDFLVHSFPIMLINLVVLAVILMVIFKKPLKELDEKIKLYEPNEYLFRLLNIPAEKKIKIGMIFFLAAITLISFHHRIELLFGLKTDTILLIAPLIISSIIMIWRREKARTYVEKDVEWWTLLFFIFLFAQAGVLSYLGVAQDIAKNLLSVFANNINGLIAVVLMGGAFISSILDNVVVVTAFIPIIKSMNSILQSDGILWWALLFGACFGGNITIIGSTANIIAIGKLEKDRNQTISFFEWLKVGLIVGLITLVFVFIIFIINPL